MGGGRERKKDCPLNAEHLEKSKGLPSNGTPSLLLIHRREKTFKVTIYVLLSTNSNDLEGMMFVSKETTTKREFASQEREAS